MSVHKSQGITVWRVLTIPGHKVATREYSGFSGLSIQRVNEDLSIAMILNSLDQMAEVRLAVAIRTDSAYCYYW